MIRTVDRAIQRGVDAVAIWLMHRGIPKSLQTYAAISTTMACWLYDGVVDFTAGRASGFETGLSLILFSLIAVGAAWNQREDQRAEERGLLTQNDRARSDAWKVLELAGLVIASAAGETFDAIGWVFCLIETYLRSTPRKPPPKAIKDPGFVPLTVRS